MIHYRDILLTYGIRWYDGLTIFVKLLKEIDMALIFIISGILPLKRYIQSGDTVLTDGSTVFDISIPVRMTRTGYIRYIHWPVPITGTLLLVTVVPWFSATSPSYDRYVFTIIAGTNVIVHSVRYVLIWLIFNINGNGINAMTY